MTSNTSGAERIAHERQRQIYQEGFTTEHDQTHLGLNQDALVIAAVQYALPPESRRLVASRLVQDDGPRRFEVIYSEGLYGDSGFEELPEGFVVHPQVWPWEPEAWKPTPHDRIRELEKAGALIAAEIDRLQHAGS